MSDGHFDLDSVFSEPFLKLVEGMP